LNNKPPPSSLGIPTLPDAAQHAARVAGFEGRETSPRALLLALLFPAVFRPHSPLQQLLAPVQVVAFIAHEIQHSPSCLLLKGTALTAHTQPAQRGAMRTAQAAAGGWGECSQLTPARSQSPWVDMGCRSPHPVVLVAVAFSWHHLLQPGSVCASVPPRWRTPPGRGQTRGWGSMSQPQGQVLLEVHVPTPKPRHSPVPALLPGGFPPLLPPPQAWGWLDAAPVP